MTGAGAGEGAAGAAAGRSPAVSIPLRLRRSTRSWNSASGAALRIWLASVGARTPLVTSTSNRADTFALDAAVGLEDEFGSVGAAVLSDALAEVALGLAFAFAVSSSVPATAGPTDNSATNNTPSIRFTIITIRSSLLRDLRFEMGTPQSQNPE